MGAPNERTVANWYSFLKYKTTPAVSLLPAISVRGALFSNGRNGGGEFNRTANYVWAVRAKSHYQAAVLWFGTEFFYLNLKLT